MYSLVTNGFYTSICNNLNENLMVKKDVQMGIKMIYYHLALVVTEAYTVVMGHQPENPL